MSSLEVLSSINVVRGQSKEFGGPRKGVEPLLKAWRNRLSVRNEKSADTYVRFFRVAVQELGTTAEGLMCTLRSRH